MTEADNERLRALHTDGIRYNSEWLRNHAKQVADHIRSLASLPAFETMAEEELDRAIAAVADLTLVLKVARSDLSMKRKQQLKLVSNR